MTKGNVSSSSVKVFKWRWRRLEPAVSRLQGGRFTQLSYTPKYATLYFTKQLPHRAILYCNHYTQVYSRDQVPAYGVLKCLLSRSTTSNYSRNFASYLVLLYLPRFFKESSSVWSLTSRYWFATRNRFHWHFLFHFL